MQMVSSDPKLSMLFKINTILKWLLSLTIIGLLSLVSIHVFSAIKQGKFNVYSDKVVDYLEGYFVGFFSMFGELTVSFLLFVAIIMSICSAALVIVNFLKLSGQHFVTLIVFIASIVLVYQLPRPDIHYGYYYDHKLLLSIFSIFMVLFGPYIIGWKMGWNLITHMIFAKLISLIVYGLLLIQMVIEIRL